MDLGNLDVPSRIARQIAIPALPLALARHLNINHTLAVDDQIVD